MKYILVSLLVFSSVVSYSQDSTKFPIKYPYNLANVHRGELTTIGAKDTTCVCSSTPIYVVDGDIIPVHHALDFVHPIDIQSISILKDSEAVKIYGSIGANGAIVITLKPKKLHKVWKHWLWPWPKVGTRYPTGREYRVKKRKERYIIHDEPID